MKNRQVLAAAVLSVASVGLSVQASAGTRSASAPPASDGSAAASGPCGGDPVAGGTLSAARQNETLSLSPWYTPGGFGDGEAISLIYQTLVTIDPTGATQDLVGAAAESWEVAEDGLSYTFHLREGLTFSNGDPVTTDDVVFSLESWADPEINSYAAFAAGFTGATAVDESTVRVDLSDVTGGFLYSLAMPTAAIVPQALVEEQGEAFFENPVGSGPFQLDEWNKGTSISFVRNENYWDPEHPLLDAVVWNFVTDDNARVLQLKSGQTQQIDSVPWTEVEGLQGQDGVVVDSLAVPSWVLLSLNHQQPEFQDLNVRMALSMAIDREAINQTLYSGLGTVPNSILPALRFDAPADEVAPIQFDMDAARALLGESAFPEGFEARLEFPADSAAFQTLAVLLQAAWGELGVTVTLHPEDQGTLSQSFRDGTYDMILPYALAVSDVIVPDEFAGFYGIPGDTNAFFSWWENPEIAALVDEFIHTADDEVRAEQWPVIQAAMQEQQPVLNVMNLPFVKARDENVCDNFATAIGYDSLLFTWIAE